MKKSKKIRRHFAHSVPFFTMFPWNRRFPSRGALELLLHKCAALPRQIAIFMFFLRTPKESARNFAHFVPFFTGQNEKRHFLWKIVLKRGPGYPCNWWYKRTFARNKWEEQKKRRSESAVFLQSEWAPVRKELEAKKNPIAPTPCKKWDGMMIFQDT